MTDNIVNCYRYLEENLTNHQKLHSRHKKFLKRCFVSQTGVDMTSFCYVPVTALNDVVSTSMRP